MIRDVRKYEVSAVHYMSYVFFFCVSQNHYEYKFDKHPIETNTT